MQFYKIDVIFSDENIEPSDRVKDRRAERREFARSLSNKCERYTEKIADKGYFFVQSGDYEDCRFGMVVRKIFDVKKFAEGFLKAQKLKFDSLVVHETTLIDFSEMLSSSCRNGYISDEDDVLREYELDYLVGHRGRFSISFDESLIKERSKEAIYLHAENYFTKDTFLPELDRIFTGKEMKHVYGHPVDYLIESDDERTRTGMIQLLLQSLYNAGRIINRRYSEVEIDPDMNFRKTGLDSLYKSCVGGAVVLEFEKEKDDDGETAEAGYYFMEEMCSVIKKHCRDVLTIICLPKECKKLLAKIYEYVGNIAFVEIKEEPVFDGAACEYLKARAKEFHIRYDKNLLSSLESGRGYMASDLNAIFDEWYSRKLKNTIFSQYKDISSAKKEVKKEKPKGSAFDELEAMIGLDSAKKVIHQALDSYKAQKMFKDKGMVADSFCNHMIFTGNPGTAKTTVARLFARIMKDNGLLSCGQMIEVGRGDLVGKYVGWTAPTIKKKFKAASGGVLFIDEAYSLVDDRDGSYGDEAINTIVQEMENHRDDVIVIFAGYPDKMEGFLDKNPGLRSRIAHFVHFEDYNPDELCEIAAYIAKQKGLVLNADANDKLRKIMENACTQHDFGNGRYVRTIVEKAKMAQSSRLVKMDYDLVTPEDVKTICAEDIEEPKMGTGKAVRRIGFAVA